jgi:hypothetical protein
MITKIRSRLALVFPLVLLITLTIFVFGPTTVYKGNAAEFGFPLTDLLAVYIIPFICVVFLMIGISFILPENLFRFYIALLFAFGLLLWIQGSFLVWNYGLFDGSLIDWSKHRWQGYIDLLIWIALLVLAMVFRKKIARVSSLVCWSLIALQGVLFILAASNLNKGPAETKKDWEAPADLYNYSDSLNVIHFMCDYFQTDVFLEIVKENSLESKLEGFTAFRDNLTNANSTSVSIPSIFSSDIYDGSVSIGDFFNKSISEKGFHNVLYQNGFKVNFIPGITMPRTSVTNYYSIPEINGKSREEIGIFKATYLLDIVVFRLAPDFAKRVIYNGGNWRISPFFAGSRNQYIISVFTFMHDYNKNIKAEGSKPVYHFIFLFPPHPPDMINSDGSFADKILEPTRANYKIQAAYTLKLFIELLDQLKQKGLYDKSMIILQSDHGSSFPTLKNGVVSNIQHVRVPAMLAIKRPNEKGNMKISDAQTMNGDVAATIMDILKIDHKFNGTSVFSIDPMTNRHRVFVTQTAQCDVLGSIYNINSWQQTATLMEIKRNPVYFWDSLISFGFTGNAEKYEDTGWNKPANIDQTTNGKHSRLNLIVNETKSDIMLEATFTPYIPKGKLSRQRVSILVNGHPAGEWVLTEEIQQSRSILIPNKFLRGKSVQLDFILPDATSPKSLNLSTDQRVLALSMSRMVLRVMVEYPLGQILRFAGEGPAQKYLFDGWGDPEPHHRWTNGPKAMLRFTFTKTPVRDLRLRLHGSAYTGKGNIKYQPVTVFANEEKVATWKIQGDGWYTADIPAKLASSGTLYLTLQIGNPMSPKDVSNSPDTRKLGVALRELVIEEKK